MTKRVVVTGGAGFIGSNLAKRLVDYGFTVVVADRCKPTAERRVKGATYLVDDLRFSYAAKAALIGADWVFHLAADMGGVGYFHKQDFYPYINNSRITFNVLEAAENLGVERVFYAASACAYPTEDQYRKGSAIKLSEDMLGGGTPDQMYGREKLAGTLLCERAPFDARVGLFHTIYGPLQEISGERMKFPTAVATKALQCRKTGQPLEIWGDGSQLRSYLYIDDAIDRIMAIMESDHYEGLVNVGAEGAVSCTEVARLCLALVGLLDHPISYNPAEPSGVLGRDCDNTKFKNIYGINPQRSYKDGFSELIAWISGRKSDALATA